MFKNIDAVTSQDLHNWTNKNEQQREVRIIQWKNGACQTMRLSFHSFGRKRFIEGSNVALHDKGMNAFMSP
jgi:hypothetical protein